MWPVRESKFKVNSPRYYYHLGSCCCCEVRDEAKEGNQKRGQVVFQRVGQHSTPFTRESSFQVLRAHEVHGLEWGCRHKILLTGL